MRATYGPQGLGDKAADPEEYNMDGMHPDELRGVTRTRRQESSLGKRDKHALSLSEVISDGGELVRRCNVKRQEIDQGNVHQSIAFWRSTRRR